VGHVTVKLVCTAAWDHGALHNSKFYYRIGIHAWDDRPQTVTLAVVTDINQ